MEYPKIINLGSGKDYRMEYLNIDKEKMWEPDIIHDLNEPILDGEWKIYYANRFGDIKIEREGFKEIIANDVLEHIQNLTVCMKSCVDLLEEGGLLKIHVPYDLSLGAWQDPTHVRAFNQMSWIYYNAWAEYLGWEKEILVVKELNYVLNEKGSGLLASGLNLKQTVATPRAVDGMRVILKKKKIKERRR